MWLCLAVKKLGNPRAKQSLVGGQQQRVIVAARADARSSDRTQDQTDSMARSLVEDRHWRWPIPGPFDIFDATRTQPGLGVVTHTPSCMTRLISSMLAVQIENCRVPFPLDCYIESATGNIRAPAGLSLLEHDGASSKCTSPLVRSIQAFMARDYGDR